LAPIRFTWVEARRVLLDEEELVVDGQPARGVAAAQRERRVPDRAEAPVVHLGVVAAEARQLRAVTAAPRAEAHILAVFVQDAEEVEPRRLVHVDCQAHQIGIGRARPVARRAVDEDVVKPVEAVEVLAARDDIDPAVVEEDAFHQVLSFEVEVVDHHFARPRLRVRLLHEPRAELVGEPSVEPPAVAELHLRPHARTEAQLVLRLRAHDGRIADHAAARHRRHVVQDLLADAQIRARVEPDAALFGRLQRRNVLRAQRATDTRHEGGHGDRLFHLSFLCVDRCVVYHICRAKCERIRAKITRR